LADASAAAIELLHCASLIHDDLPCFDAAATRRGKPSVHAAFGEPIAVLTGDGLIVLAFERLADAACSDRSRTSAAMLAIARGVGAPGGIVAGQAWESEAEVLIDQYHAAKTGALFVAATTAGAVAGGGDARAWRPLGEALGAAYQAADDLLDAVAVSSECDKPVGRDAALGRPSLVAEIGAEAAAARLRKLVDAAVAAVPSCPGENDLRDLVRATAMRLSPKKSARRAA
jgi:geranylgeranyl diphosphate synthase type II